MNEENLYHDFWKSLLEECNKKTNLFNGISPSVGKFIKKTEKGLAWKFEILKSKGRVELRIQKKIKSETGKRIFNDSENERIFEILDKEKETIEEEFHGALNWWMTDQQGRIYQDIDYAGLNDREKWDALQERMIDAMIKLEKALRPHIKKLKPNI